MGVTDINNTGKILKLLEEITESSVEAGILGEDKDSSKPSLLTIAATQEFGSEKEHIPERSFIRASFDKNKEEYGIKTVEYIQLALAGTMSVEAMYTKLGQTMAQDIQMHIRKRIPPALSRRTLEARRRRGNRGTTPLIDTGRLFGAVSYEVK
jgi:hypothetical protein